MAKNGKNCVFDIVYTDHLESDNIIIYPIHIVMSYRLKYTARQYQCLGHCSKVQTNRNLGTLH